MIICKAPNHRTFVYVPKARRSLGRSMSGNWGCREQLCAGDCGWNSQVSDETRRLPNCSVLPSVLEAKVRRQSAMATLWEDPSQGCTCLSSCCVLAVQSDPSGTPFTGHRSHHEGFIHSDSPSCGSTYILVFGHWGGALFENLDGGNATEGGI